MENNHYLWSAYFSNLKSTNLLVGDEEFADSSARVNKALWLQASKGWELLWSSDGDNCDIFVDVATRLTVSPMNPRILMRVKLVNREGAVVCQPFYKSSGANNPEIEGMWLPTSGIHTSAYAKARVLPDGKTPRDTEGWIAKEYFSPRASKWVYHRKTMEELPKLLQRVSAALTHAGF